MENKKVILLIIFNSIVFLTIFATPVSALSENRGNTFSFRFEDSDFSDVLSEISEKSGIKIIANGTLKKESFTKSYVNRSLDSIIADLLRGENCAVVWNYSNGNLHSIDLYTFDENGLKRTGSRSTAINRTTRNNERSTFSANRNINEVRSRYLREQETRSRNRSNRTMSTSRRAIEKNTSDRTNTNRANVFGTSNRTTSNSTSASGTSSVSANIRRSVSNVSKNQNNEKNTEKVVDSEPSPELPEPEESTGLERPPMPPGL